MLSLRVLVWMGEHLWVCRWVVESPSVGVRGCACARGCALLSLCVHVRVYTCMCV